MKILITDASGYINIRIDAHRFVVQRALSLMSENKTDR